MANEKPWTHGNYLIGYNRPDQRVWILNQRLHHGAVGVFVIALGTFLAAHDRRDWKHWFRGGLQCLNVAACPIVIDSDDILQPRER